MTAGIVNRAPWTRRARRIDSVLLLICYIWRSDEFMASKSIQTVGWHQVYFSPYNFYASLFPAPPLLFLSRSFPFPLERSSSSAATLPASLLRSSPLAALPARWFLATVPSLVSPPLPSVGLPGQAREGNGRNQRRSKGSIRSVPKFMPFPSKNNITGSCSSISHRNP